MTPEPYQVAWTGPAKRALVRLAEKVASAIVELCYGALAENPQRVGKALRSDLAGLHSARRGDFRVIYLVREPDRRIVVLAIEHRSHFYRPL